MTINEKEVRTPTQKRSKDKKQRIIDAAIALVAEKGFLGTGIRDIVSRASVSTGTFYSYYKDKNDIFIEVLSVLSPLFFETFADEVRKQLPKARSLEEIFLFMINKLAEHYSLALPIHKEIIILTLTEEKFDSLYNKFRSEKIRPLQADIIKHFGLRFPPHRETEIMTLLSKTIEDISKFTTFHNSGVNSDCLKQETASMLARYIMSLRKPVDS
ncbi:MAG: TetR/AcrR family transcriptional regulator [bacterium]|nr:TetR/AcrR family transcriptional regulator [bacterium]